MVDIESDDPVESDSGQDDNEDGNTHAVRGTKKPRHVPE